MGKRESPIPIFKADFCRVWCWRCITTDIRAMAPTVSRRHGLCSLILLACTRNICECGEPCLTPWPRHDTTLTFDPITVGEIKGRHHLLTLDKSAAPTLCGRGAAVNWIAVKLGGKHQWLETIAASPGLGAECMDLGEGRVGWIVGHRTGHCVGKRTQSYWTR